MIGFRKALKKFEKIAKVSIVVDSQLMFVRWFHFALQIPAQQAYTVEKIEPNTFASSATVQGLLKEIEELYATHFSKRHTYFRPFVSEPLLIAHGDKDRKSTRLNSSHSGESRMPSSA